MANRLEKTPLAVYTPAVVAVPPLPGYCSVTQVYGKPAGNATALSLSGSSGELSQESTLAQALREGWDGIGVAVGQAVSPQRPQYTSQQVCYPPQPGKAAVPSQVDLSQNAGWNAGARSVAPVPASGYFRCVPAPQPTATVVGLTPAAFDHSYGSMPVAVVLRPGGYTLMEYGAEVSGETPYEPGANLELRRLPTGEVEVHLAESLIYTSTVRLYGELYAGALLYSLQDSVDSPKIGPLAAPSQVELRLPKLQVLVAEQETTRFQTVLPSLQLTALAGAPQGRLSLRATLPAVRSVIADRKVTLFSATLPAPRLTARAGRAEAVVSGMTAVVPTPTLSALSLAGTTCTLSASWPRLAAVVADRDVALLSATLPVRLSLFTSEPFLLPGELDGSDVLISADRAVVDAALLLLAMDTLGVASTASLTLVLELQAMDALTLAADTSLGQLVELLALEQVLVNGNVAATQRQALQYAVNALTGAPTRYQGFDFTAFVRVGGDTYGLRKDGLYRIGDVGDDGEVISALVDFGTTDFGDSHAKRMDMAYLGVRTDGQCFLRVGTGQAQERVYRVRGSEDTKRAKLSAGVVGRNWSLKLELVDVSFAELDSLELAVGLTQRRSTGHRTR